MRRIIRKIGEAFRRGDLVLLLMCVALNIFGMLMKIGGWEKYSGNRNASLKRAPYGTQRCFVRVNALPDGCASENAG